MSIFNELCHRLFHRVHIPESFSEDRYMTAYPDCNNRPKKHYKTIGFLQNRICYVEGDMGNKKSMSTSESPLVSIIVTSYNYEKYIRETLDSILAQTYSNYEVIVIDDGSKDNSVAIITEYAEKHHNIRLIQHEDKGNHGLPCSMKRAITEAKGEYIAFCESDDQLHPENIEKKVRIINEYNDVVIVSNAIKMFGDEDDIAARGWVCQHIRKLLKQGGTPIDLRYNQDFNFIPTLSSVMIRSDVLMGLNYDTPVPAWIDFWLYRQILINSPLYFADEELTLWRQHDSFNGNKNSAQIVDRLSDFLNKSNKLIGLR